MCEDGEYFDLTRCKLQDRTSVVGSHPTTFLSLLRRVDLLQGVALQEQAIRAVDLGTFRLLVRIPVLVASCNWEDSLVVMRKARTTRKIGRFRPKSEALRFGKESHDSHVSSPFGNSPSTLSSFVCFEVCESFP
jgi:hypothetical protein